jgi:hypothetical protein
MDAYFEAWQRNNAGTLLANTFIQHDQNSVPIADLNGKTLDEVFIGGNLVVKDFSLGNVHINTNTRLKLTDVIPMINTNKYWVYNDTYTKSGIRVAYVTDEQTDYLYTMPFIFDSNWQTTLYNIIYTATSNGSMSFAFSYADGRVMTVNDIPNDADMYIINLTALGITATQAQLDFWYSVWQQNHKLGMRVHRASGNDIPLAVLNNQSLNQVFVGGQLLLNPEFTGNLNNWSVSSAFYDDNQVFYDANVGMTINQNITSKVNANDSVYILSNVKFTTGTTGGIRFILGNATVPLITEQQFTIDNINYKTYSMLLTPNLAPTIININRLAGNRIIYIDNINLYNLTSLGIATLTQSQLDYLFTVWQFNQVNALVARQFIQEA